MPALSVEIIAYNQTAIDEWRRGLQNNEFAIITNSNKIQEADQYLLPLKSQLRCKDAHITAVQSEISYLRDMAIFDSLDHHHHHHHHYHHSYGVIHAHSDEGRVLQIINLESELRGLRVDRARIIEQMWPYQSTVAVAQEQIKNMTTRNQWLNQQIPAAELFLQTLDANPAQLVTELYLKMQHVFTKFQEHHFVALSPQVRLSLMYYHQGLGTLLSSDPDKQTQRQSYLKLCAFMADLYSQVRAENKDNDFIDSLVSVINTSHVYPQHDLPDHLVTGKSAHLWYQEAKINNPHPFAITEHTLVSHEAAMFQQEINFLLKFPENTVLQQKIVQAAKTIQIEVLGKVNRNESVDFYFYTRMTENLMHVYNNPKDVQATKYMANMAEYASGCSSVSKKVLGSVLVVLGILVIAASVAALLATWGSSSILSAWGMALGLSLLGTQIAGGVGFTLTAAAGTGLTFWGGALIKSGMRQGLSQELVTIQDAADRCPPVPVI